jgi:hypothetical protein
LFDGNGSNHFVSIVNAGNPASRIFHRPSSIAGQLDAFGEFPAGPRDSSRIAVCNSQNPVAAMIFDVSGNLSGIAAFAEQRLDRRQAASRDRCTKCALEA